MQTKQDLKFLKKHHFTCFIIVRIIDASTKSLHYNIKLVRKFNCSFIWTFISVNEISVFLLVNLISYLEGAYNDDKLIGHKDN